MAADANVEEEALRQRCLQDQLSELVLLKSMYNVPEELQFAISDSNLQHNFLDEFLATGADHASSTSLSSFVDEFSLKLKVLDSDAPVELTFRLPPRYPHKEPLSVFVRCSSLDGQTSCHLNSALRQYVQETLALGEPQVMNSIHWIHDNLHEFQSSRKSKEAANSETSAASRHIPTRRFQRLWLYSHHIYSKFKRKDIVTLAGQLDLTGFCMPGKPGVVCVEGAEDNCCEFWDTVRTWTWKKLIIRHRELIDLPRERERDNVEKALNALRKFGLLKEIAFGVRHGSGREFHMDMAGFNKFLIEHECGFMFPLLFGLESAGVANAE